MVNFPRLGVRVAACLALLGVSACAGRVTPNDQTADAPRCFSHEVLSAINNSGQRVTVYELIGAQQTPLFEVPSGESHSFWPKSNATYGARAGSNRYGQWMAHSTIKGVGNGQVRFERSCESD